VHVRRALTVSGVGPPHIGMAAGPRAPNYALRTLESTVAALVDAPLVAPAAAFAYVPGPPPGPFALALRAPGLPELQRANRTFVRAITEGVGEKGGIV
jgi:hypothetical protein